MIVSWLGLGIRIGVALFLLPFIINRLGVDRYGEYFFLAAIFGYSELLDLGLRASILRYVGNLSASGDYDRLNRILGSVFRYYAMVAVGVVILGILVYLVLPEERIPAGASSRFAFYAAMFSAVAASSFFRVGWSSVVQARERYDLVNLIETGAFLLRAAVIVVFLSRGHGLMVLIAADILNNLGSALCSRVVAARIAPQIRPDHGSIAAGELREVANYSGWAFLNSMAFQIRFRGPGLIVGGVLTTTATGCYGVAARIQSYVLQLGTAMNAPFRARATTIAGLDDQASMQDILFRGTRMLTFVGLALGSTLFVHAEHLLVTWMNPEFGAVASVLRVLLIGLAVEISVLMLGGGLFATGRLRFYAISNLCEAGGIILLATLLARRFGLDGAAFGIMIPLVINKGLFQPAFLLRFLGVSWMSWVRHGIIPPVIALGAALIPILLLFANIPAPQHLSGVALQMVLAGLIHLAAGWFIVLRAEERAQALTIIRRRRG